MTLGEPPNVHVDLQAETISIYGITYALVLFRHIAVAPIGKRLQIIGREDGVVTFRDLQATDVDV